MALVGASGSFGGIAGSNAVARLLVVVSGTSAPLTTALSSAEKSLSGFGASASTIGSAMTRSVTLPLLAIGGASVAMATQFQGALGRIAGLTPILDEPGQSLENIRTQLLDLAQTVPTGPVELANALYFAGSAGLDAATAMDIVKLSAQGAAIGMGDAADISKVLIFAMNNYGSAAFDAGTAMDALTVAIREGTAEPEEMAIALGRLLPVAKEAGVTFEEVVGSVAALTNVGFPARVATTSLRALFSELLSPTEAATNALKSLGLTAVDVSNTLRTGGPIAAFQLLEDATGGDAQALHDIIPQIRGFSAFLALTNDQMTAAKRIFEATTNSTGALKKAFDIISKTPGFKFEIGLNKLKVAAIELGDKLIPVFLKITDVLGKIGDLIANMPDIAQTGLAGLIVLGAAVGPALQLYGALTRVTTVMTTVSGVATKTVQPAFSAIATGLIVMSLATIVAIGSFNSLASGSGSLISVLGAGVGTFIAVTLAIKGLQAAALSGKLGAGLLSEAFVSLGAIAGPVAITLAAIAVTVGLFIGASHRASVETAALAKTLTDAATSGLTFREAIKNIQDESLRNAVQALAQAHSLLGTPVNVGFATAIKQGAIDLKDAADNFASMPGIANGGIGPEFKNMQSQLEGVAAAAALASKENISLDDAAAKLGININDVTSALTSYGTASVGANDETVAGTSAMIDQIDAFKAIAQANKDYQIQQLASIANTAANSQATKDYANELGVSADYLSGRLQEFGVEAGSASSMVKDSFETMAFTSSETGKTISASMAEAQAAVEKTVSSINDSLGSGFTLFEKLDNKVKKSAEQLVKLAEAQSRSLLQEAANLKTLAERGVPADLIAKIADQGPGVVQKFVDASKTQLRRLETAYATGLGAIDNQILQESAHQQVKGHNMVADFATAILSSSNLTTEAARSIVQSVTDAVSRGNLRPEALTLIQTFVNGLGTAGRLSKNEGARATRFFAQGLQNGNILNKAGNVMVSKLATGLQRSAGLTQAQASRVAQTFARQVITSSREVLPSGKAIVTQLTTGIESGKDNVKAAANDLAASGVEGLRSNRGLFTDEGTAAGAAFATGLRSSSNLAAIAAADVATNARNAFDKALQNSPEYFTYYMGKKLSADLQRGLDDSRRIRGFRPVVDTRGISHRDRPTFIERGRGRGGRRDRTTLDVHIGRERFNREINYSVRGSGK